MLSIKRLKNSLTFINSHFDNSGKYSLNLKRQYNTSALYIPGGKAFEIYSYLTPYLDYDKKFSQIEKLHKNFQLRGIKKADAYEIKKCWNFYQDINVKRKIIEEKREAIAHKMKKFNKKINNQAKINSDEEKELNGLMIQGRVLKQNLRAIKEILWELEETVIPRVLKLPNDLHETTPENREIVLKIIGSNAKIPMAEDHHQHQPEKKKKTHLEIGKSLGLLEYFNPMQFYLCNEAALFEVGVQSYASELLNKEEIFRLSGMDFGKSLLVEATGLDHEDPFATFLLNEHEEILNEKKELYNRLHLIGGASLISFLAMHTKQLINPKDFPLRYYATGRSYLPPSVEKTTTINHGLFGVCQTSAIHCMSMVLDSNDKNAYQEEFQKLITAVTKIYNGFEKHYRIVLRSAGQLEIAECLRMSIEMWSSYHEDYVEVGHISMYGDYFSKRLLIAYQTPTGRGYPAIISGTILNINKLLACLLEENSESFHIPECVKKFIPIGEFKIFHQNIL